MGRGVISCAEYLRALKAEHNQPGRLRQEPKSLDFRQVIGPKKNLNLLRSRFGVKDQGDE